MRLFCKSFFFLLSRAHDLFSQVVFSFLLSRAQDFFLCMSFFLFCYLVHMTFFILILCFFYIWCVMHEIVETYGGIFRTYIVLFFISCARLFLFSTSFFLFYYLVRTTFLFHRSFFLFYYLVRTTFLFRRSFFLFFYLVRTTLLFRWSFFLFFYLVRTTLLFRWSFFFFSFISCARLFFSIILLYIQTARLTPENKSIIESRAHEIVEKKKRSTK